MIATVKSHLKIGPQELKRMGGAVALSFVVAALTIWVTSDGRNNASIWLADAVMLALLLGLERTKWPIALVFGVAANHLANDLTRGFHLGHLFYGVVNMGQVWLAAAMIRRKPAVDSLLADLDALGRFFFWAGLVAPAVGAFAGAVVSVILYNQDLATSFIRWMTSNALGFLVATPLLKALFDGRLRACWRQSAPNQRLRMAGILAIFIVVVSVTFLQASAPFLFLPVSALVLLAFQLGRIGVKIAVVSAAIIGAVATMHGIGPIALMDGSEFGKAAFYQFYLAALLVTGMVMASIIASREEVVARLGDREKLLRSILDEHRDVMISLDGDGTCTFCGGPSAKLLGLEPDAVIGLRLEQLASKVSRQIARLDPARAGGFGMARTTQFQREGAPDLWLDATLTPLAGGDHLSGVVTIRDITDQRQREVYLSRKAYVDDLTQVWNRAGFDFQFEEALASDAQLSLAIIDVDWFKAVNDTFGQASGDDALIAIARVIGSQVRWGDAVGRIGGDEFAIMFRTGADAALSACERIADAVARLQVRSLDGRRMALSISCGVAGLRPGMDRHDLFAAADAQLYRVKSRGRNGVALAA